MNLAPQDKLTDKDMWGATMLDQLMCRVSFKRLNYDGIYTPPSENGTLVFPGNLGVFEWGGMSVNPDRQVAVMNPIGLPFVSRLIPADPNRAQTAKGAELSRVYSQCMACLMVLKSVHSYLHLVYLVNNLLGDMLLA